MTLRLRLLLVLVGIVAAGLIVADAVTYNQLDSFLYSRTDQQLADSSQVVGRALQRCLEGVGPLGISGTCDQYLNLRPGAASSVTPGTWAALLDANGDFVGGSGVFFGAAQSNGAAPSMPANLPGSVSGPSDRDEYFSASNAGSSIHYQVLAEPVLGGGTLVVAIPTSDIAATLGRLLWIEALVTLAVLLALGTLAWWIVRQGLRPLDEMAETAGAIAQGDLTRRVADDGGRTEVGQLGVALNAMLGNIEAAFAARDATEERLRRFLADASHELRTPLTSIRGYAEMFDRGARDRPEDLATSMHHIRNEADRMTELVNDLLLLARLDRERPLERERLDLNEVVGQAVHAARVSSPARTIGFAEPGPVLVDGDASRLRQVVDNLLSNAVRHTPPGSPVEVRLRGAGPNALLEVEDRGPGVAPDEQEQIFEPFHRADASRTRSTGGMGLGLAIVAAITRAHGGSVGVGPASGGGSVFWVRLPLASSRPPTSPAPNGTRQADTPAPVAAAPAGAPLAGGGPLPPPRPADRFPGPVPTTAELAPAPGQQSGLPDRSS